MRALAIVVLLLAGCSFETEALDDVLGTSCGYYEADRFTMQANSDCWELADEGKCFSSEPGAGACGKPPQRFFAGQELVMWCPVGTQAEAQEFRAVSCR